MKILMVCHYFAPEIGAPQARLSETSKVWASLGHDVEVLTGMPNHPTGIVHDGYQGRKVVDEKHDGYRVVRTWLYATPNTGIVRKTLGHLSFMVTGLALGGPKLSKPDVVVVSSPTFFSIFTAWVLAKLWRRPLVVEVRDLWPGIFVELGVLTNRWVIGLLERLELAAYRAASTVVVVTEGFKKDLIRRGVPAAKVAVITNGVDLERFEPGPSSPEVRTRLGAESAKDILVVYIGAHGISHGLDSVLNASTRFESHVKLAFVGEGAEKPALVDKAKVAGYTNVSFHNGVDRDEVLAIIRSADVLLVPLRNIPLFETFIPSKMFEFMAVGTAVVGAVAGEAKDILERAGAPVVEPENPNALAETINELASSAELREKLGALGREFVEHAYDRRLLAVRYLGELADSEGVFKAVDETTGSGR